MASANVDNRGSFGSKRSRNDVGAHCILDARSDGDWTCPECGNINFGFRTVCNRAKCAAPRPPVLPSHAPMTSHYNNPPPFYIGGFGPPPMPYGVSTRYGSPIPHSGMHYDYGAPPVAHGAYGPPVPTFPPGGYGGMGYASPSTMNGYGFGFPGSPWSGGMSMIPENPASRKRRGGPDGSYDGDWICPKCENVNFAFRTVCNIKKCGAARPSLGSTNQSNAGAPEGSWTCGKCGNVNYPFRTVCNRKECGTEKPSS
ncbi:ranBP2-type zinc finger protein At1g67325-like isoform X2 [Humulus lupulus]|uniref:ranBP2-type zinc finger protein At1g67325-like isoform X2 n=1 Tax=Humulus lupulus TaxID=3486 RepID=UPI002B4030C3|nr:ranBP2-type zinc finger protein At1g67325-like isoform X2 [Humulus lupulus]